MSTNKKIVSPKTFLAVQAGIGSARALNAPRSPAPVVSITAGKILQAIKVEEYWLEHLGDRDYLTRGEADEMLQDVTTDLATLRGWLDRGESFDYSMLKAHWALLGWDAVLTHCAFQMDMQEPTEHSLGQRALSAANALEKVLTIGGWSRREIRSLERYSQQLRAEASALLGPSAGGSISQRGHARTGHTSGR